MYQRLLKNQILKQFFKGKVIIITGARQTGKTTLSSTIVEASGYKQDVIFFNCDNPVDRDALDNKNLEFLIQLIGKKKIIVIDEGQKVNTIGQTLKLLIDYYKDKKQILVTGSSSINLLENIEEPLTGRKYSYTLFPLSVEEIFPDKNLLKLTKELEILLIFGSYPEIESKKSFTEKIELLKGLSASYLYKDILEFQKIKNSAVIANLLKALALQIGSEVSYSELANLVGVDKRTIENYIDLLEKNFIIFRLPAFAKNKRREISRLKKIFFYDLGIRNSIINNFNFLNSRNDIGALWENFLAIERLKYQTYHKIYSNNYFWRTYDGSEVDWIEEREGKLFGYEFKWGNKKTKFRKPLKWLEYPESSYKVVTPKDLLGFII